MAEETVTLSMALAVCPATEPALLQVEIESESDDLVITAVSPKSGSQTIPCTQTDAESCSDYTLPLNDIGSYTLTLNGLDGLGSMIVANETISYTLGTSEITLRQENVTHWLSLTGANSLDVSFTVSLDEIGCPLADFRSLTARVEPDINGDEPFPGLAVAPQYNLTITDLGAEACQAIPEP